MSKQNSSRATSPSTRVAAGHPGRNSTRPGWVLPALVVLLGSLVLGCTTSFAQGLLPHTLQPFANSASGWTILTALLVWAARREPVPSALFGAASFVALVLGYTVVSSLRGYPFSPLFWASVGVLAGPLVGAAAAALHQRGRSAAAGAGVLAGVLLGDSGYGLTTVSATTGHTYWVLVGVLGVCLLVAVAVHRLRTARLALLATGCAVAVALLMDAGYLALNAGVL